MPSVRLDFAGLEACAAEMDALAARTPGIDRFCSGSAWTLAAREAFAPGAIPVIVHGDAGMVALMVTEGGGGGGGAPAPASDEPQAHADEIPILAPLEASWGLACPLLGPDPRPLAELLSMLTSEPPLDRLPLVVMGLPAVGPALRSVVARIGRTRILRPGPDTLRVVAELAEGVDAYLGARGSHFRAGVRRAERAIARAGLELEALSPRTTAEADAMLARALAVEGRSWKGLAGSGLVGDELLRFNQGLTRRLASRGTLRALILRRGAEDVGFVFGAIDGEIYRGLQASFDAELKRASPGSVLHIAMMRRLTTEGVTRYDLGSDMPYKRRWGDPGLATTSVIALPRG